MESYNRTTSGLAGLLQGFAQGRKDRRAENLATTQAQWQNPNAPIGENERLRAQMKANMEAQAKLEAFQNMFPGGMGQMFQSFPGGQQPLQQQTIPQQSAPQVPTPQNPSTPASVDRSGQIAALIEELYQARIANGKVGK